MGFPNYKDRLPEDEAMTVRDNAEVIGDSTCEKDCFWRGYRVGKVHPKFYVGLCDGREIWEVDEQTMIDHCVEDKQHYAETERIRTKDSALMVIALDPRIKAWLEVNDPKALEQVRAAIKA